MLLSAVQQSQKPGAQKLGACSTRCLYYFVERVYSFSAVSALTVWMNQSLSTVQLVLVLVGEYSVVEWTITSYCG